MAGEEYTGAFSILLHDRATLLELNCNAGRCGPVHIRIVPFWGKVLFRLSLALSETSWKRQKDSSLRNRGFFALSPLSRFWGACSRSQWIRMSAEILDIYLVI